MPVRLHRPAARRRAAPSQPPRRGRWRGRWGVLRGAVSFGAATVVALMVTSVTASGAGAQPRTRCPDEQRVRRVAYEGAPRFTDATLELATITRGESFWSRLARLNRAPCVDTLELRRDALRIAVLHRQAGWFLATVSPQQVPVARPTGVRVAFVVDTGPRVLIDSVVVLGLPDVAGRERPYGGQLDALAGQPFDRQRVDSLIDRTVTRLRDAGFARATRPVAEARIDTATARAVLTVRFAPGPRLVVGAVQVQVRGVGDAAPTVDSAAVMGLVGVRTGQRFSARALLDAQRDLYRTEAFAFVLLDTVTAGSMPDSLLDLRITLAQARTRTARLGLGWATQDCGRLQGRIADRGFLGPGRRVELSVRASKLGIGAPVDVAPGLCSGVLRSDPFSERLNYYVGASLSNTRLFGLPLAPTLSVYSERRGEPFAYLRETPIGALAEVTHLIGRGSAIVGGFQYENGRTITDPVVSCSRFGQCRPEDFALNLFGRGVTILSLSGTRDRTNDPVDPQRGSRVSSEFRAGETFSGLTSDLRFYRGSLDAATHTRMLGGVLATRVQVAHVWAPGAQLVDGSPLVPQQERLFAGGQNSVRGFQQNLLGPVVYLVNRTQVDRLEEDGVPYYEVRPGAGFDRAVPRGGTALSVANVEYRRRLPWLGEQLQVAAFVDAGHVWEAATDRFRSADLRATPGLGMRLSTPLGPFRVDIGYQPYLPRAGRALFLLESSPEDPDGGIYCASPGNRVAADPRIGASIFDCPESFRPPRPRGVLSRLVFHFGLGQAF